MVPLLLLLALAHADEPTALIDGTTVRGSAHLEVPPARVLAQLQDPVWESSLSATGTRVEVKGRTGECQHLALLSPNPVVDASYEVRRCPTEDGFQSTLITSAVLATYRARWRALPEGEGSRITYEVDLSSSLWVPETLVRSETRRSVLKMMTTMVAWAKTQVGGGRP